MIRSRRPRALARRFDRFFALAGVAIAFFFLASLIVAPPARSAPESLTIQDDGTVACPAGGTDTPAWPGGGVFDACNSRYDFIAGELTGAVQPPPVPLPGGDAADIPGPGDWSDAGVPLSPGPPGSWDERLAGLPCLVYRADGQLLAYYGGGAGSRVTDGEPKDRAFGAAVSTDGLNFVKDPGNPLITPNLVGRDYGPTGEGGVFTCALRLESNGEILAAFGFMDEVAPEVVDMDVWIANCGPTGLTCGTFTKIVAHDDPAVPGSGELGVRDIFLRQDGTHVTLYTSQESPPWTIGVATGLRHDRMTAAALVPLGPTVSSDCARQLIGGGQAAYFCGAGHHTGQVDVYTAPADHPVAMTGPVESYVWLGATCREGSGSGATIMDPPAGLWRRFEYDRCWPPHTAEATLARMRTAPITYNGPPPPPPDTITLLIDDVPQAFPIQGTPSFDTRPGGVPGAALVCDGDDWVDTGLDGSTLADWTFAAWVNAPAPADAPGNGPVRAEDTGVLSWDHPAAAFRGAAAIEVAGVWYAAPFGALPADTWVHIAATYDGETLRAYVGGLPAGENAQPSGPAPVSPGTLRICGFSDPANRWGGKIDGASVWTRALSDAEIGAL